MDDSLVGLKLSHAINNKAGETVVPQGRKITAGLMQRNCQEQDHSGGSRVNDLEGAYIAADVVDMSTGEVMIDANQELTPTVVGKLIEAGIETFRNLLPGARRSRHGGFDHAAQGSGQDPQGRSDRNLPQAAPGRSAHRSTRRPSCSKACSSTRASTISRAWAA